MADGDAPASLVAVRDRREAVIKQLSDSFANDLIDVDAFEARLANAHAATSIVELDKLIADLAPVATPAPSTAMVVAAPEAVEAKQRVLAIFSTVERRGGWRAPRRIDTVSVFGNAELDFREAALGAGVTEVHVRAVFGNVEIIVPPELAVECEGAAVFGAFTGSAGRVAEDPGRPVLRVRGAAVFGNVEVVTRLVGESERDARRRRRQTRRLLRAERRARGALPPARDE